MKKIKLKEYNLKELYPHKKMLSSSQMLCYDENPANFYVEYTLGAKRPSSVAMKIGSIFSELHENRKFDFRQALIDIHATRRFADLFDRVIKVFPVVPAEVPLKCKFKGWTLRATLDGFEKKSYTIIENKTGQTVWTQERADESDQITFQSFVHWKKYKKLPEDIILNWVDLRARATKNPVSFHTIRTIEQLEIFEKRVIETIKGIEAEDWTPKFVPNKFY